MTQSLHIVLLAGCTVVGVFAGLLALSPERPTQRGFEGDVAFAGVAAVAAAIAVAIALI